MTPRAWALFAAVCVLWGIPYLFTALALQELSPLMVAWGRVAVACAVLMPYALWRGALAGTGRLWAPLLAWALLETILPWPLIAFGQQRVSSGLAAILIASVPLIVAVLTLRFDPDERPDRWRLIGLLVGFGGVVCLIGLDVASRPGELIGALALVVAASCYASGGMVLKLRLGPLDPVAPVAVTMAIATVVLALPALATAPSSAPSTRTLVAVVVLGVFCSALAFVLFVLLLRAVGPSRASVITYVNPAIAVLLGVIILGESVGTGAIAGLLLILAGSWLATGGRLPPSPKTIAGAADPA